MSKRKRKAVPDPPDLQPIMDTLRDARALVNVAYRVMEPGKGSHGEIVVLRFAAEALERVVDQLDHADIALARFRKGGAT